MLNFTCEYEPLQGQTPVWQVDNRILTRNGNVPAKKTGDLQRNRRQNCYQTSVWINKSNVCNNANFGRSCNKPALIGSLPREQ